MSAKHAGDRSKVMMACGGTMAPWTASLTFGGADLQTLYIGSLRGSTIPYLRAPVPGLPMVHWNDNYQRGTT
jgi:gluconolactonase